MIENIRNQTYPMDKMNWIIIDDGTDKIEDLVKDISFIKIIYKKYDEKMTLGKKRNLMHKYSTGDILVYIDDDDYYPPERVFHAVDTLQKNKNALCAGSSEIYIWFKHIQKMYQFGPYGPKHGTAGTFAFRKELLKQTSYDENASLAEEKAFLKNYSIPFVQLDPVKTILVFSHIHNTFDKKTLLGDKDTDFCKTSPKTVKLFVKREVDRKFYMDDIENLLINYEPGEPKYKPDVIKQTNELKAERNKMAENAALSQKTGLSVTMHDGTKKEVTVGDLKGQIEFFQNELIKKNKIIESLQNDSGSNINENGTLKHTGLYLQGPTGETHELSIDEIKFRLEHFRNELIKRDTTIEEKNFEIQLLKQQIQEGKEDTIQTPSKMGTIQEGNENDSESVNDSETANESDTFVDVDNDEKSDN